ncbi:ogr/Delta-like zinc finger family protein, partial [Serratia marcescens]
MSNITRRSYHQCNNMLCGCTFTTTTTLERYICTPNPPDLSDGFRIPRQAFPS